MSNLVLNATISGSPVRVFVDSTKLHSTLDLRSDLNLTVIDTTGLANYQPGQPVRLADNTGFVHFDGFIDSVPKQNLSPNDTNQLTVKCTDNNKLASNFHSKHDHIGLDSGDIAADYVSKYLAQNGVHAGYAIRHDTTKGDFATGTLSNLAAANNVADGNLELAPAGTPVTLHAGGAVFNPVSALRLSGTCLSGYTNPYHYHTIWTGSQVIASGDTLRYDIWIQSDSPEFKAGVDFVCSDGTTYRDNDNGNTDAQNLPPHPKTDLNNLAMDNWYPRALGVSGTLIGKTISAVSFALEGDSAGTYTAYIRNVRWQNGATVKQTFFGTSDTAPQTNAVTSNNGYRDSALSATVVYDKAGSRTDSFSIDAAKIVKSSFVTFVTGHAGGATGVEKDATAVLRTSIDGGVTWQVVTDRAAIPGLQPGMKIAGRSLSYRMEVTTGKDPSIANYFVGADFTINPAYQASKTDVTSAFQSQSDFNTGTKTNTKSLTGGGLTLDGYTQTFDALNGGIGSWSTFGTSASIFPRIKQVALKTGSGTDVKARANDAGNWQDFTTEVDIQIIANSDAGIVYRTTNWGNSNDSYAYAATFAPNHVQLATGSNSTGVGAFTSLQQVSVILAVNSWHRLKVVVSGTNHKIFLDGIKLIDFNDATYTASGGIGLRFYQTTGSDQFTLFDNFGVCSALSGTWQSPAISISGATTYGTSLVEWDSLQTPDTTSIAVQSSVDGGSTFQDVTNGGVIPGLTLGQSLAAKTLILKATMGASNAPVQPTLGGISVWVQGQYSASGTRIAPAMSLSTVGRAGSTLVSWNGIEPVAGGTIDVATSLDNVTYTPAGSGASGSASIAGITTQLDPVDDTFDANTSSNYTNTSRPGGAAATVLFDTTNSRVSFSGGTNALLVYSSITGKDVDLYCDLDQTDAAGLIWRYQDASNYYALTLADSAASGSPNTVKLYKVVAGVKTQIGGTVLQTITRGHPYRVRATMLNNAITVYFDGSSVLTATDSSIASAGKCGLHAESGIARFYQFRFQILGQDVTALLAYSRVTLTSTDPTIDLQLTDLTLSVRSPDIETGAFISQTAYSILSGSKNTLSDDFDDLAKKSDNFLWQIASSGQVADLKRFTFQSRNAKPAPWIVTSDDVQVSDVRTEAVTNLYRNSQFALGGTDTRTIPETRLGDGVTSTWNLGYAVDSINSIKVNGVEKTIGQKGVDTGRDFYFTPGSNAIVQEANQALYNDTQTIIFNYQAQVKVQVHMQNDAQIATLGATTSTDGIVEAVLDLSSQKPDKIALLQACAAELKQYAILPQTAKFTTKRAGLEPGMIASLFLPKFQVADGQFLITDKSVTWKTSGRAGSENQIAFYTYSATSGPLLGDWTRWIKNIAEGR